MRIRAFINILQAIPMTLAISGLVAIIASIGRTSLLAIEGEIVILSVIFILYSLVKPSIINWYLNRTDYQLEFVSLLKQLKLNRDIDIVWNNEFQEQLHREQMITLIFLQDNKLSTEVYEGNGLKGGFNFLYFIIGLILLILTKFVNLSTNNWVVLGTVVAALFFITAKYAQQKDSGNKAILLKFKLNGLEMPNAVYSWPSIESWEIKYQSKKINLILERTTSEAGESEISSVDISKMESSRLDMLLLLAHFKNKHG